MGSISTRNPRTSRSFIREDQISKAETLTEAPGGKEGERCGICHCPVIGPVSQCANGLGSRLTVSPIPAGIRRVVCATSQLGAALCQVSQRQHRQERSMSLAGAALGL